MPPQPGIFALPYGTTHSQGGGLASSSHGSGGSGGKASRGGLTSFPNSQQDSNMVGVVNGDMGLSAGSGYRHASNSTQLQQQQQQLQQHPSHHPQHSHSPLGHGQPLSHLHQNQHLHHNFHQHGGAVAGPSSRVHVPGSIDDTRKDNRKRKEISGKLGKEMGDRRDELSLTFISFRFFFPVQSRDFFFSYYNPYVYLQPCLTLCFFLSYIEVAISLRAFRHYIILPTF